MDNLLCNIAVGNPALLSQMPFTDVLTIHPLLNLDGIDKVECFKVKPMKAIQAKDLFYGIRDFELKLLRLATLEGMEEISRDTYICIGEAGDTWQQSASNIEKKYDRGRFFDTTWYEYTPKPGVSCYTVQITKELVEQHNLHVGKSGGFSVLNNSWGDKKTLNGTEVYLQYGKLGDYVMFGATSGDTYVVAKKIWENTYSYTA